MVNLQSEAYVCTSRGIDYLPSNDDMYVIATMADLYELSNEICLLTKKVTDVTVKCIGQHFTE
jgi:hypothetical protein